MCDSRSEPLPDRFCAVLGSGLRLTTIGVVIGALLGAAAARAMSGLLFGIQTFDLAGFALAVVTLLAVAVIASYVPGRRASRSIRWSR